MAYVSGVLRIRRYGSLALVLGFAAVLFALYTFFDLREGGRSANLATTNLATPAFYVETFGGAWFYGSIALNALLALMTGALVMVAFSYYRRRDLFTGAACSAAAPVFFGFATFGCPGCVMPVAGSLGASFFAASLPLLGLEFKVLSILVVGAALFWMARRATFRAQVSSSGKARCSGGCARRDENDNSLSR